MNLFDNSKNIISKMLIFIYNLSKDIFNCTSLSPRHFHTVILL